MLQVKTHHTKHDTTSIVGFIFASALIALLCAICIKYLPITDDSLVYFILFGIESASPALSAALIIALSDGLIGLKRYIKDKYCSRFHWTLCVAALFVPMLTYATAKVVASALTSNAAFISTISEGKLLIIAWALIAEELGWRGFLQERTDRIAGAALTPLIIGIVWSAWHFHFFINGATSVPFLVLALGCIFESYGYYVITMLARGNVIPASLWHFSGNLFINMFALSPDMNGGSILPYIIANLIGVLYLMGFPIWLKAASRARLSGGR